MRAPPFASSKRDNVGLFALRYSDEHIWLPRGDGHYHRRAIVRFLGRFTSVIVFYFCINYCVASMSPIAVIIGVPGLVGETGDSSDSSDPLVGTSIANGPGDFNRTTIIFFMLYLNKYLSIIVLSGYICA